MDRPEVLGEPLLLITSEFEESDKRLDLLLLDRSARLVVAELKLDASGTLADQQAIRYAAFCSTIRTTRRSSSLKFPFLNRCLMQI